MQNLILGPFIGHTTESSVKIWVHWPNVNGVEHQIKFSLLRDLASPPFQERTATASAETLWTAICEFQTLDPDTTYFYRVTGAGGASILEGSTDIEQKDLKFRTFPRDESLDLRTDFLLLSCHNPEAGKTDTGKADGFEVWAEIPNILKENPDVRFAILGGDQVYLDDVADDFLKKPPTHHMEPILDAYRKHWGNKYYRKVLCSLPSYLMWDDHDIVDGWGSELGSFEGESATFKKEWSDWFSSAKKAFWFMQASRNLDAFGKGAGGPFDSCFRIGNSAFVLADLRSNRNVRQNQIWLAEQFDRIKKWVSEQGELDALFFVTPVVFAHGDPKTEEKMVGFWPTIMAIVDYFRKFAWATGLVKKWDKTVGDLRDDLNDSWFSEANAKSAAQTLDYLFTLQNAEGSDVSVAILSGDIHTAGYSNIYSDDPKHGNSAIIPHIVSSPVAYSPLKWIAEAYFRSLTKTTRLSADSPFKAQISHHYCFRCATVVSLRVQSNGSRQLKVKYYLEGFEEPSAVVFDLEKKSHRERLAWRESGEGEARA